MPLQSSKSNIMIADHDFSGMSTTMQQHGQDGDELGRHVSNEELPDAVVIVYGPNSGRDRSKTTKI